MGEGGRGEVLVLIVGEFLGWQERRGEVRGEEDPEMSMLGDPVVGKFAGEGTEEMSLFSWLASFGRMDRGKILILMAYKFLTRWEDIPWRVVGGKGKRIQRCPCSCCWQGLLSLFFKGVGVSRQHQRSSEEQW